MKLGGKCIEYANHDGGNRGTSSLESLDCFHSIEAGDVEE